MRHEGRALADHTVVVEGERIVAVAPSGATVVPPGVQIIDGRSKYVVPGLWEDRRHWTGG